MNRANYELLCPLIVADRLAEARREALAELSPPVPGIGDRLALFCGAMLISLGRRLDALGRRHEMLATPFVPRRWTVVAAGSAPKRLPATRPNR